MGDDRRRARRVDKRERKKWRPRIYQRDLICQSCGFDGKGYRNLFHVAHITSKARFKEVLGPAIGVPEAYSRSYREDNLVLLCMACHSAEYTLEHHGRDHPVLLFEWPKPRLEELAERMADLDPCVERQEWDRLKKEQQRIKVERARRLLEDRYEKVDRLFRLRKVRRGWQTVRDLFPNLVG